MGNIRELMERGVKHKIEGSYDGAMADFLEVIRADSRHAEAHRQLGLVYGFVGMFDESVEELSLAASLGPSNISIKIDLAKTYAMLGMYDEAKDNFTDVLSVDPENKVAIRQMSYLSA